MYLISRCLLGYDCKYDGGNNYNQKIVKFSQNHNFIAVCPETSGGLKIPRPPAEYVGERIIDREGNDVTDYFILGAEKSYAKALREAEKFGENIEGAILKANSPSCGSGFIYDGNFNKKKVVGDGCFTRLLKAKGIDVISEKEI